MRHRVNKCNGDFAPLETIALAWRGADSFRFSGSSAHRRAVGAGLPGSGVVVERAVSTLRLDSGKSCSVASIRRQTKALTAIIPTTGIRPRVGKECASH